MDIQEAIVLVKKEISNPQLCNVECVILEKKTICRDWGWVFFYQSKGYIETGDFRYMLGGNAPIIVNKHSGEIVHTGTAQPTEYYINEYEATL
jgi:hypothetical protein